MKFLHTLLFSCVRECAVLALAIFNHSEIYFDLISNLIMQFSIVNALPPF